MENKKEEEIISGIVRELMNQRGESLLDVVNRVRIEQGKEERLSIMGCFMGWNFNGKTIYIDKRCEECLDYKMCKLILQAYEIERKN